MRPDEPYDVDGGREGAGSGEDERWLASLRKAWGEWTPPTGDSCGAAGLQAAQEAQGERVEEVVITRLRGAWQAVAPARGLAVGRRSGAVALLARRSDGRRERGGGWAPLAAAAVLAATGVLLWRAGGPPTRPAAPAGGSLARVDEGPRFAYADDQRLELVSGRTRLVLVTENTASKPEDANGWERKEWE